MLRGALLLFAGACSLEAGAASDAAEPRERRAHEGHREPMKNTPARLREWPALRAWLDGADVMREPLLCPPQFDEPFVNQGRQLFALYCVNCHGAEGRGNGPRAPMFNPPPRDLAHGVFKFRSTPTGVAPTSEDLFRTVSGGLRGTGMMPFVDLPEIDRWAIVAYVQKLSTRSLDSLEPSVVATEPPTDIRSAVRAARGRRTYELMRCGSCHGENLRGDGSAAATLVDDKGRLVSMPDLGARPLKRGDDPATLYTTLVTGLDGTPMPSYADATREQDRWDLIAFMSSLLQGGAAKVSALDRAEAQALVQGQYDQAVHAVVEGCGCRARAAIQR